MSTTPEAKMLDCPFCGGRPNLVQWRDTIDPNATWVECACGAMFDSVHADDAPLAQAAAIERWNRRAPQPGEPTVVEALREARKVIAQDRQVLFDCHVNPDTGSVEDSAGRQGIAEYDAVLAKIDAALGGDRG